MEPASYCACDLQWIGIGPDQQIGIACWRLQQWKEQRRVWPAVNHCMRKLSVPRSKQGDPLPMTALFGRHEPVCKAEGCDIDVAEGWEQQCGLESDTVGESASG